MAKKKELDPKDAGGTAVAEDEVYEVPVLDAEDETLLTNAITEPVRGAEIVKSAAPRQPQPISTIEAVFEEWGSHAIWVDDTTEVALWNSADRDFTDYYEVRRFGKTAG